jgi:TPR repeat protein
MVRLNKLANYGWSLERGWSGVKNLPGAMNYYKMAAEKGDIPGMRLYTSALQIGFSGTPDENEAKKYWEMADEAER